MYSHVEQTCLMQTGHSSCLVQHLYHEKTTVRRAAIVQNARLSVLQITAKDPIPTEATSTAVEHHQSSFCSEGLAAEWLSRWLGDHFI